MTDPTEPTIDDVLKFFKDSCTAFEGKYAEALARCDILEKELKDVQKENLDARNSFNDFIHDRSALEYRSRDELNELYQKFDNDFKSFHGDAYDRVRLIFDGKQVSWKNILRPFPTDLIPLFNNIPRLYSNLISCYAAFNAALMVDSRSYRDLIKKHTVLENDLKLQKDLLGKEYVKVEILQKEKEVLSKVHGQFIVDFDKVNISNNWLNDKIAMMEQEYRLLQYRMVDTDSKLKRSSDNLGLLSQKKENLVWLLGLSTASLEDNFDDVCSAVIKLKKENSYLEDKLSSLIVKEEDNTIDSKQLSFNFQGIVYTQNIFFEESVSTPNSNNSSNTILGIYRGDKSNRGSVFKSVIVSYKNVSYKKYIITGVAVAAAAVWLMMLGLENYSSNKNRALKHTSPSIITSVDPSKIKDGYSQNDISEQYDVNRGEKADTELIGDNNSGVVGSVGVYNPAAVSYSPIINVASREDVGMSDFYDTNSSTSNSVRGTREKRVASKVNRKQSESCGSEYTIASFKKPADWSEWSCQSPFEDKPYLCLSSRWYINKDIADKHNLELDCHNDHLCCPKYVLKSKHKIISRNRGDF